MAKLARGGLLLFLSLKGREEKMAQICNSFSRIYITFPDLKTYNFATAGMSECGKEAVTTSAVMPDVDRAIGCSDNPKHSCLSFHCEYLQKRN